ncbi:MAG: mopR [Cellvibrio sp.]|nr:mopR [Cellvibrio sp.]
MYTLNMLVFDPDFSLDSAQLDSLLKQLPLEVTWNQASQFLNGHSLPRADITIFVYPHHLVDQTEPYQKLCSFLSSPAAGINLCLIPAGTAVNSELVAHFDDFLFWPCTATELRTRLSRLLKLPQHSFADNSPLLAEFASLNLIGKSSQFVENIQLIKKMSACHAAVLIQGETGTGKENAARAIHYLSKRREQSFVPVNCAAIPDNLVESELFGHEKGAFTDAKQTQAGLVALADGGTLFLDEIDSLTPKAQAALLRFLQTLEYRALGAKQTRRADVRILAATNADLKNLVANKQFREDLYFRLNVLNLTMPPLRKRLDDIVLIADNILHRFALEYQAAPKRLGRQGLDYLMQHAWPGNIRELENCLLRAFLLSPGETLEFVEVQETDSTWQTRDLDKLSEEFAPAITHGITQTPPLSFQDAKAIAINEFEANYLRKVMLIAQGNVSVAARLAGKERRSLGKLLQKYAIDKAQFQSLKGITADSVQNQAIG